MVEPILHYLLPTLTLLAFYPVHRRLILMLSPLTVILDLDFLLRLHRWAAHSVTTALLLTLAVYAYTNRSPPKGGKRPVSVLPAMVTLFMLSSHLLLDLSPPGIPIAWPASDDLYSIRAQFYTDPATLSFTQNITIAEYPLESALKSQKVAYLTNTGAVAAILLTLALTAKYGPIQARKRRQTQE